MRLISRYGPTFFYAICLFLAIGCFYFSFSEGLFSWLYPDELVAIGFYKSQGFLGCVKSYYLSTTINRFTADLSICAMAKGSSLFNTAFMGWVFVRLVLYTSIPLAIAFLLKEITKSSFWLLFFAALMISSSALFILSDSIYYMFGLDLAIYAMATATFFALCVLLRKSIESDRYFGWFCLVFGLNLNSHEIFLVISGFCIPLYAWYISSHRPLGERLSYALQEKKVWILCAIYLISTLATLFAPGAAMRQHIWPSTGTYLDGLVYVILSVEETAYFVAKYQVVVLLVFLLGMVFRGLLGEVASFRKNGLWYGFLFSAPFFYLLITGFLLGLTPTLMAGSSRTSAFQWMEPWLMQTHFALTDKAILLKQGGLGDRQNLFLYTGLFLDFFLAGFFLASAFVRESIKIRLKKAPWCFQVMLLLLGSVFFLLHPDGMGSMGIVSVFSHKDLHLLSGQKEGVLSSSILEHLVWPGSSAQALSYTLFPRVREVNHGAAMAGIVINNFLKEHRGTRVSPTVFDPMYSLMIPAYRIVGKDPWRSQIYGLYGLE